MTATATKKTMGRLDVDVQRTGDGDVVRLVGQVDDQATLSDLLAQLGTRVIIDLGGVRFINSVGVREWIVFLASLSDRGSSVVLRNVSEPMIHQMNMVVEASGKATIESFHAPFVCEGCGSERSVLIDVAANLEDLRARKVPPQRCPECSGNLLFDDFPNRYLLFLD